MRGGSRGVGVVAALTVLMLIAGSPAAAAAPATGGISGTVYSSLNDQPIPVALVTISHFGAAIFTDSHGKYGVTGLAPGPHTVGFSVEPGSNYLPQWYDGEANLASADPVRVQAGKTATGIDAYMLPGGVIAGKVTDAAGRAVADAEVFAVGSDYSRPYTGITDAMGMYSSRESPC